MNSKDEINKNCVFCDLPQREQILEETKLSYVAITNPSMTPGHLLVIPKRHVWEPWQVTEEELIDMYQLINKYRQKLEAAYGPGSDIRQQYRPFVPEGKVHNIRHVHYHIIPRHLNDPVHDAEEHISSRLSVEQLQQTREKLR